MFNNIILIYTREIEKRDREKNRGKKGCFAYARAQMIL